MNKWKRWMMLPVNCSQKINLFELISSLRPAQLVALASFILAKVLVIISMLSILGALSYSNLRTPAGITLSLAGLFILISVIACIKDIRNQLDNPEEGEENAS